jgi:hypothetical protein
MLIYNPLLSLCRYHSAITVHTVRPLTPPSNTRFRSESLAAGHCPTAGPTLRPSGPITRSPGPPTPGGGSGLGRLDSHLGRGSRACSAVKKSRTESKAKPSDGPSGSAPQHGIARSGIHSRRAGRAAATRHRTSRRWTQLEGAWLVCGSAFNSFLDHLENCPAYNHYRDRRGPATAGVLGTLAQGQVGLDPDAPVAPSRRGSLRPERREVSIGAVMCRWRRVRLRRGFVADHVIAGRVP